MLGYPLSHSLSPQIHEHLFALSNVEAQYDLIPVSLEDFPNSLDELFALDGFNITIPYKMDIMKHLSSLSDEAKLFNSVNTVCCNADNALGNVGYNTDVFGFLQGIEQIGADIKNCNILLLGAGGSANMIATQAVINNSKLTIAVRNQSLHKAEALKIRLLQTKPDAKIKVVDIDKISGEFTLLVNSTPVGMYPNMDACPVGEDVIKSCNFVYDLIYNPIQTKLLQIAQNLGKPCSNGLSMLVYQAAHAHKIWYGAKFSPEQISEVIRKTQTLL